MITSFFDINTIFFTLWDYPMSFLEFFGTISNILCVWLAMKKSVWNWPVGIVAVILFAVLFYQVNLYSDFFEQIYYFLTGFWGWWAWSRLKNNHEKNGQETITRNTPSENIIWGTALVIGTIILGGFMARINTVFPEWFSEPASFPYLDAFTTIASFIAQILLIRQRLENWYLWIVVDIIGVWLYFEKEVKFVSALYLLFLILATGGLIRWQRRFQQSRDQTGSIPASREEVMAV